VYPQIFARQRLDKRIPEAMNKHATIEELLESSFSMPSVSYERDVGHYFLPELFVIVLLLCAVGGSQGRL
jgi:hypothetical protein